MNHSQCRSNRAPVALWTLCAAMFAAACGELSEERWTERAPTVSCQVLRRCDPIDFHRDYADLDACVAATDDEDRAGCTYDPEAARSCREALGWTCARIGREYDRWIAQCESVWTCDTGVIPERPGILE